MFWFVENHFLSVGLFIWGNAYSFGILKLGRFCIGGIPELEILVQSHP